MTTPPAEQMGGQTTGLLPCPFCGCADVRPARGNGGDCYVFCHDCHCEGAPTLTRDSAIAAWNRRAPAAPSPDWRRVPEKATSDMVNQGADAMRDGMAMLNSGRSYQYVAGKVYTAMLAASPALSAAPTEGRE